MFALDLINDNLDFYLALHSTKTVLKFLHLSAQFNVSYLKSAMNLNQTKN